MSVAPDRPAGAPAVPRARAVPAAEPDGAYPTGTVDNGLVHLPADDDADHQIDRTGLPPADGGRGMAVMIAAVIVALLALTFTLGWVAFNQITTEESGRSAPPAPSASTMR